MSSDEEGPAFPHRHPAGYDPQAAGRALGECAKADCARLVKSGVLYCCAPCAEAAAGQYEIEAHSAGCDQRSAERGAARALV